MGESVPCGIHLRNNGSSAIVAVLAPPHPSPVGVFFPKITRERYFIEAGDSIQIDVTYHPTRAGQHKLSLVVREDAVEHPITIQAEARHLRTGDVVFVAAPSGQAGISPMHFYVIVSRPIESMVLAVPLTTAGGKAHAKWPGEIDIPPRATMISDSNAVARAFYLRLLSPTDVHDVSVEMSQKCLREVLEASRHAIDNPCRSTCSSRHCHASFHRRLQGRLLDLFRSTAGKVYPPPGTLIDVMEPTRDGPRSQRYVVLTPSPVQTILDLMYRDNHFAACVPAVLDQPNHDPPRTGIPFIDPHDGTKWWFLPDFLTLILLYDIRMRGHVDISGVMRFYLARLGG